MRRKLTLITLVLLGVLLSASAQAYVTIRLQNGNTLRWGTDNVDWTLDTGGMPGMNIDEFQDAIEAAFESWEDVDCATIGFTYKGLKSWDNNQGIHVYVQTTNWDPSVGDALAYALPDPNWQGVIQSVDVVFNAAEVQWTTSMNPGYGYQDVQGVATHEIGHAIGLDHPRYPDSTMFFSGGSAELRSLAEDDERGACFLYPVGSFTEGIACDACDESANCANGYCLSWGGGEAFCGENCTSDSDCAQGFRCQFINDDIPSQCIPENDYCHDAGGNIPNGEFCYGNQTCEGGVCLVLSDEIYCSQTCTSWCPSGMTCVNGVCLKAGNKAYGALCDESSECVTGTCIKFTLDYGTCTLPCGANGGTCPNGNQCYFDSVCVPPGAGVNGQPCYTPIQCQGTYCLDGACTQPCTSTAQCPAQTTCVQGYCDGVLTGGSCNNPNDCAEGLTCQKDTNSGPGECHRACEPLADTGCFDDEACQWRYESWAQYITGRCLPKNGGALEGEACGAGTPCEENLICHIGKGSVETCHRDCKLFANNLGCTLGQSCESLGDPGDPKHGICTYETGTPSDPNPGDPDPSDPEPSDPDPSDPTSPEEPNADTSSPGTPESTNPEGEPGPEPSPEERLPTDPTGEQARPDEARDLDREANGGAGAINAEGTEGQATPVGDEGVTQASWETGGCQGGGGGAPFALLILLPLGLAIAHRRQEERR